MRRTVGIAVDLLDPALLRAFTLVFPTAQSKSIVGWVLRPVGEADVVCCEPQHAGMLGPNLRRNQLRLWFAPRAVAEPYTDEGDVSIDPGEVHVFSVLHALDMAALRFIDGARYPRYADTFASTVSRGGPASSAPNSLTAPPTGLTVSGDASLPTDAGTRYSLKRWVQLGAMFRKRHHLHATGLMARQELTFDQLVAGAGMAREDALDLLRELRRVGVLRQSAVAALTPAAAVATAVGQTPAPARNTVHSLAQVRSEGVRGMLGRLRDWLSRDIGRQA